MLRLEEWEWIKIGFPASVKILMKMNIRMRTLILFFALLPLLCFADKPRETFSIHCPKLTALNPTTIYYHDELLKYIFSEEENEYRDEFYDSGIALHLGLEELRLLTSVEDSAVCQKINEKLLNRDTSSFVYDRELHKYSPAVYRAYYEFSGRFLVLTAPYSAGSNVEGKIGAPSIGWIAATIYDKKNLNLIGQILL